MSVVTEGRENEAGAKRMSRTAIGAPLSATSTGTVCRS